VDCPLFDAAIPVPVIVNVPLERCFRRDPEDENGGFTESGKFFGRVKTEWAAEKATLGTVCSFLKATIKDARYAPCGEKRYWGR